MNIEKIVMFKRGIETLSYFSEQMGKRFEKLGYQVFYFDLCKEYESMSELIWFCQEGDTVVVSFNFDGCSGEECFVDSEGTSFFTARHIPFINIVVDHPFYYHKFKPLLPENYIQISIDREHEAYMRRFFPEIRRGPFLPLGGTCIWESKKNIPTWDERIFDIVFTGNYNPPEIFNEAIHRHGEEYSRFYYDIIDDFKAHPWKSMDATIEEHIRRDAVDVTEDGIKDTMPNMIFIDLYVRHWFRGEVVKTLADAGLKVCCFGTGWEKVDTKKPENLVKGNLLDSYGCLRQISQGKISLNVMPWFKAGAHDRVFNSMCNGAVCLTDSSRYLDEIMIEGKHYMKYELWELDKLPDIAGSILNNRDKWEEISEAGYEFAMGEHTWSHRADAIDCFIREEL
ncbi:glycosyltransferase [Eubacterium xylanophilum]|uniref:glycosyltransferase n=1 Tax=Eubacterium xylanophilum TaxID=39497 RepID=UPI0004B40146|nr:glycosyltransferase [Eubacterium xylanophilum]